MGEWSGGKFPRGSWPGLVVGACWSSGAMVARYTRALSAELAVSEFHEAWS